MLSITERKLPPMPLSNNLKISAFVEMVSNADLKSTKQQYRNDFESLLFKTNLSMRILGAKT
jgi:hypothetical protein